MRRAPREITTRNLVALIVLAALACLPPILLWDEDPPDAARRGPPLRGGALERIGGASDRDDAPRHARAWHRGDDSPLGSALRHLDAALTEGFARCAPEVLDRDRAMLTRAEPDWLALKDDLLPGWSAWLDVPGVVIDDARVQRCAAAARAGCAALAEAWQECTAPFRGTLGEGDGCFTNQQCVSQRCRPVSGDDAPGASPGECLRPDDCATATECPTGMLCAVTRDEEAAGGPVSYATCVDPPAAGETCATARGATETAEHDPTCGAGLVCDVDVCAIGHGVDEECDDVSLCGWRLACVDGRCAPVAEDDGDDDASRSAQAGPDSCSCDPYDDGYACVPGGDDGDRCVPAELVGVGAACDARRVCAGALSGVSCVEGRCAASAREGAPCDGADCAPGLACIDEVCAPFSAAGVACHDDDECAYGLVCGQAPGDDGGVDRCVIDAELSRTIILRRRIIRIDFEGDAVDPFVSPSFDPDGDAAPPRPSIDEISGALEAGARVDDEEHEEEPGAPGAETPGLVE